MSDVKPLYRPYLFFLRVPNDGTRRQELVDWLADNIKGTYHLVIPHLPDYYGNKVPGYHLYSSSNGPDFHRPHKEYDHHILLLFEDSSDALLFKLSLGGEIYGEEL
jgi:hypothetical protein